MKQYGLSSRILHRLALAWPGVGRAGFDLERMIQKAEPASREGHVFVTGLARAGTTILMRSLHASGQFASATYRDMPFVMMPNLWRSVTRSSWRTSPAEERAHGDGIYVNEDSPEALEEVFWRTFLDASYVGTDGLQPHEPDGEALEAFRVWIGLILKAHGKSRYLSKNNNTILRLPRLADEMAGSTFVVPFRNPFAHAQSLLRQHERFVEAQEKDRFVLDYMTWLGHHEFGLGHKPFRLGSGPAVDDTGTAYWLKLWIGYHRHLLEIVAGRENVVLVSYESLCSDDEVREALADRLDISGNWGEIHVPPQHQEPDIVPPLRDAALEVWQDLKHVAKATR